MLLLISAWTEPPRLPYNTLHSKYVENITIQMTFNSWSVKLLNIMSYKQQTVYNVF